MCNLPTVRDKINLFYHGIVTIIVAYLHNTYSPVAVLCGCLSRLSRASVFGNDDPGSGRFLPSTVTFKVVRFNFLSRTTNHVI